MVAVPIKLVLWKGCKHSGKTTCAFDLIKTARKVGFNVAGLLAPSLYYKGKLIGFDALHLQNNTRAPLARCNNEEAGTGLFTFINEGLKLGHAALSETATKSADLVIVDEFGPLELDGRIWRKKVDSLLSCSNSVILLIVRKELAATVRQLYSDIPCSEFTANKQESIDKVLSILKKHHKSHWAIKSY